MSDQATQLRQLVEQHEGGAVNRSSTDALVPSMRPAVIKSISATGAPRDLAVSVRAPKRANAVSSIQLARAIAFCSGKGGVGKTNLAVNIATALAARGKRVCLFDADLGMANADVLCNLAPKRTLDHVLRGQCTLADVMLLAPGGFRLVPGASGVARVASLNQAQREGLLRQFAALERVVETLIIDTGAGIGMNVLACALAAHSTVVVTTPEPTAITDAYGLIKSLAARTRTPPRLQLLVNMAVSKQEAADVYLRMNRASERFLNQSLTWAGWIPRDDAVPDAVRARMPFSLRSPKSPATRAVHEAAATVVGLDVQEHEQPAGRTGFLNRLTGMFGSLSKNEGLR